MTDQPHLVEALREPIANSFDGVVSNNAGPDYWVADRVLRIVRRWYDENVALFLMDRGVALEIAEARAEEAEAKLAVLETENQRLRDELPFESRKELDEIVTRGREAEAKLAKVRALITESPVIRDSSPMGLLVFRVVKALGMTERRFHFGGLAADEIPAILQPGEEFGIGGVDE